MSLRPFPSSTQTYTSISLLTPCTLILFFVSMVMVASFVLGFERKISSSIMCTASSSASPFFCALVRAIKALPIVLKLILPVDSPCAPFEVKPEQDHDCAVLPAFIQARCACLVPCVCWSSSRISLSILKCPRHIHPYCP